MKSDFMKKVCGDTSSGTSWNCDPSKLSADDLKQHLHQFLETTVGQEALQAWKDIVEVVQDPLSWIQNIIKEWLPKLKKIVTETWEKLKQTNMDGYFDIKSFG